MQSKLKHVAIILDGNRRYAKKHRLMLLKGHEYGAKKVEKLFDWCRLLGIKELTLYVFSMENFKRSKNEVNYLMNLFRKQFKKLSKDKRIDKDRIRISFIGRLNLFPKDMQEMMKSLMKKTKGYKNFKINFAIGYGGRAEIIDATKKMISDVKRKKLNEKDINENLFKKYLYLSREPDLLIRPGGDLRISNFLIWQSSYTELYFTKKLWPEFTKNDLKKAIDDYKKRERRFGG